MRVHRMVRVCAVPVTCGLWSAAFAAAALAHAPGREAPPVAEPDKTSAVTINGTRGGKSSLPEGRAVKRDRAPQPADADENDGGLDGGAHGHPDVEEAMDVPPPKASLSDVEWGLDTVPPAVRRTHASLLRAAKTGDIEALRPIFGQWEVPPIVAYDVVEDPVAHLKMQSGDDEGREILAILAELLESGHVMVGEEPRGTYVWPYFAEVPLEELSDPHYVDLYRILTAIDVEEIERQGRYTFFRVGIEENGRLRYFSAGEME